MAEDPDYVFRDFNTPGIPSSGESKPEKSRIRALLKQVGAGNYPTLSAMSGSTIPANTNAVWIDEREAGRGGGAMWVRSASNPDIPDRAKVQDASGAWWMLSPDGVIRPEMMGGFPHIACDAATKAWYDACDVKPSYFHFVLMDRTIRGLKWAQVWDKISWLQFAGQQSLDVSLRNVKSPSGTMAFIAGTVTHIPGIGIKGDGSSGYIVLPNASSILSQDNSTIALSVIPGTVNGNVLSTELGTTGGITLNPGSGSSLQARMMNGTALTSARESRSGVAMMTRDAGGRYRTYIDRNRQATNLQTSIAPPSSPIWLLRSGTSYQDDTLQFVAMTNTALDELQGAALDFYCRRFFEGVGGALDTGPSCASIGFSTLTSATNMADVLAQCSEFASIIGAKVELGLGTYQNNGTYPIDPGVETYGVNRRGSILRSTATGVDVPLIAPRHFNGGTEAGRIHNLTLDGNATDRGFTNSGLNRPGGSVLSTNGSRDGEIDHCDMIDSVLHHVDYCNTGEVSGGQRRYATAALPTKYEVGIASTGWHIHHLYLEAWGDDGVTMHHSWDFNVHDIEGVFRSYRHDSGHSSGNCVEADDGSHTGSIRRIKAIGVDGTVAVKNHGGNPGPYDVNVEDVDGEYASSAFMTRDWQSLVGNNHARNVTLRNPYKFEADSEVYAVLIGGAQGSTVDNVSVYARGDEAIDDMVAASAVNTAADTITVRFNDTKHAKWATEQRVQISTTGTLPAPLVALTDYFVIRVDETTIKLATSAANATAGTAINLTTQGTGHHTIANKAIENAIRITNGAKNVRVTVNQIANVTGTVEGGEAPIVITSSCEDATVVGGKVSGAGKYGIHDLGSLRGRAMDMTLIGTGVSASVGVYREGGASANDTMAKNMKISGFTAPHEPAYNGYGDTLTGNGSPEGVISAIVGTEYRRLDGSTATTLYVKTSGAGNTGWTAK